MPTNDLIKLSTYKNDFGFKVPYLLEIGSPQETNYTAICYPIGSSIFGGTFALDFEFISPEGIFINPYTSYGLNLGSKSNVSLTKEIVKMLFDKKLKRKYKLGTLSSEFGFELEVKTLTASNCGIELSVSDGSKLFVNLNFYSIVDVLKWDDTFPVKSLYLKLLSDNFSTKEDLLDCAKQLYSVKNFSLAQGKNLGGVSSVNK
jgi:hypothetical protein